MAGKILGFHVLDHIIFTKYSHKWFSYRQNGLIENDFEPYELSQYVAELSHSRTKEE